ncbi:MAG: hypothetical protein KGL39_03295 [Patescibacteria group bacterium]|nr:hypothetical protein [Patescibacteria group bacterium]
MTAYYVVERPFEAGKRPSDFRQYRPGDKLTAGDISSWPDGQLKEALRQGYVAETSAPEPAPEPEPAPDPAPVHQS